MNIAYLPFIVLVVGADLVPDGLNESDSNTVLLQSHLNLVGGAAKKPHIVFFLVDDLGYNDFIESSDISAAWPNAARLAETECMALHHYYTWKMCSPSRAAFLTGRHPFRYGMSHGNLGFLNDLAMPTSEITLPEKLQAVGYKTYLVGKWHVGFSHGGNTPLSRGFNHFYGFLGGTEDHYTHKASVNEHNKSEGEEGPTFVDLHDNSEVVRDKEGVYSTELFTTVAIDKARHHQDHYPDSPFFLYFSLSATHTPLQAPSASACEGSDREVFCSMAHAVDKSLGNLTAALKGIFPPTDDILYFVSGDNGGDFSTTRFAGNNCREYGGSHCLRGAKFRPFEGGIRNNALVCSPTLVPDAMKGAKIGGNALVTIEDLHAIILGRAGAVSSPGHPIDGLDLWHVITSGLDSPRLELIQDLDPCGNRRSMETTGDCRISAAIRVQGCISTGEVGMSFVREHSAAFNKHPSSTCGEWKYMTQYTSDPWYPIPSEAGRLALLGRTAVSTAGSDDEKDGLEDYLFKIDDDKNESTNLLHVYPEVVSALKARLAELAPDIELPCNVPGGSCNLEDPRALAKMEAMQAVLPFVPN